MDKLVKNQLGYGKNLFIYQDKTMFNYSVDTILLGNFLTLSSNTKHVLDVGTNNGALAIFLAKRKLDLQLDAIEINADAASLAVKNIELNQMEKQIKVIAGDFNQFWKDHNKTGKKKYDAIICNPPFYKVSHGLLRGQDQALHQATHEYTLSLDMLVQGAAKIVRQMGLLTIVEPIERLVDVFEVMRKYRFEPKRVQFVYARVSAKPNLVLIEARFQAGWGTKFLPNLYLHPEDAKDHRYLPEVQRLYEPLQYQKGQTKHE